MMKIIGPLRIKAHPPLANRHECAYVIGVRLRDRYQMASTYFFGLALQKIYFLQERKRRRIKDGLNGIKPQPVKPEFSEPLSDGLQEVPAHFLTIFPIVI